MGKARPNTSPHTPAAPDSLWPSSLYAAQVGRLRTAIGEAVFVCELCFDDLHAATRFDGWAHVLLDVMAFPRPDPARRLFPHMLLLDDGRGLNLARVARVSRGRAYDPPARDVLYLDRTLTQSLLFQPRRLSPASIADTAQAQLGRLLGKAVRPRLK